MGAIFPTVDLVAPEPQPRFVNESRRLQGLIATGRSHSPRRHPAQVRIRLFNQALRRLRITVGHPLELSRDFVHAAKVARFASEATQKVDSGPND